MIYLISNVRRMKWPWLGISTASKTTDVPLLSPPGDHATRKDDKETSQAVERRPG